MLRNLILVVLLLAGCSSAESKSKWYMKGVQPSVRKWRHCTEELDGPSFHEKGICYKAQRCRKTVLRNEKCETIQMYCAYEDKNCIRKNYFPHIKKR